MEQNQYLKIYQSKFEYLEFNPEISNLFIDAYNESKNGSEYTANFQMDLENKFIFKLIALIKKGNQEVHDALLIYCEKYNNFYLQKKKNSIKDLPLEKINEYYNLAFELTIDNFKETELFYRKLMQNIIMIHNNSSSLEGVLNMKYNLSVKSIYELLGKYDKEIVKMVLDISKITEPNSISLLIRKYGPNFEGTDYDNLTYVERSRIDNILSRIEKKIELAIYFLENGKTMQYVNNFLKKADDTAILNAFSSIKNNKSNMTSLKSISQIKEKYNVTDAILKLAIDFNEEDIENKIFNYTFGFTVTKKSPKQICELLELNFYSYNKYLNSILEKLPNLINRAKEYNKLSSEVNSEHKNFQMNTSKNTNTKKVKSTFFEYFYDESTSEEEKEKIKEFVIKLLNQKKNTLGYALLIKRYGIDYCSLNENIVFNKEENGRLNSLRQNIRIELKKVKKEEKNPLKNFEIKLNNNTISNKPSTITSFFEYFYTDDMSKEQKEELKNSIFIYLENRKNSLGYTALIKKFGTNYETYNNISLTRQENNNLSALRQSIRKEVIDKKDKSISNKTKRKVKNTFYEYFYEENMSEKSKIDLENNVKSILEDYKHLKGYSVIIELFSNDLKTKNNDMKFNKQKAAMYFIINKIKDRLQKINEEKTLTISNESKIEPQKESLPNSLNYIDTIIYKLTNMGYSIGQIVSITGINMLDILISYVRNINYYHIDFVIDMILTYNPGYLFDLLNSDYFVNLLNEITPIEKQLIYYLILLKNNKMSIESISELTGLTVEDISNYQIYSKEDKYIELNNYISLSNINKTRKISI